MACSSARGTRMVLCCFPNSWQLVPVHTNVERAGPWCGAGPFDSFEFEMR
jgi:hypothetical protein